MHPGLVLLIGLVLAGFGGELFLRGIVGLAAWLRIPAAIVGSTLAAFATSSPEISVAVSSGLSGNTRIALGDALGSNVVNVGLVLGLTLAFGPMRASLGTVRRDFRTALAIPILTAGMVADGEIGRIDAGLLLLVFVLWLVASYREAQRHRAATEVLPREPGQWRTVLVAGIGALMLVFAGGCIVDGAGSIAQSLGISTFVIGATIVAIGTSTPELVTALLAAARGHQEVGIGTVFGSNVFNGCFIVGIAAMIHPIQVDAFSVLSALTIGTLCILLCLPRHEQIPRWRSGALLGLFALHGVLAILLQVDH
jgi:cation:H+ antiporter